MRRFGLFKLVREFSMWNQWFLHGNNGNNIVQSFAVSLNFDQQHDPSHIWSNSLKTVDQSKMADQNHIF
jgi:hypothetical protein